MDGSTISYLDEEATHTITDEEETTPQPQKEVTVEERLARAASGSDSCQEGKERKTKKREKYSIQGGSPPKQAVNKDSLGAASKQQIKGLYGAIMNPSVKQQREDNAFLIPSNREAPSLYDSISRFDDENVPRNSPTKYGMLGGSFPFGFEGDESVYIEVEEEGLLSLTNKQVGIGAVEQETVMDGRLCRPCFDDH